MDQHHGECSRNSDGSNATVGSSNVKDKEHSLEQKHKIHNFIEQCRLEQKHKIHNFIEQCRLLDLNRHISHINDWDISAEEKEQLERYAKERNERVRKEEEERKERLRKEEKERNERLLQEEEKNDLVYQIIMRKNIEGLRKTLLAKSRK